MSEYINREEVCGWLVAHLPKHEERIEQIVNHVPSIEIVHCKDCKCWWLEGSQYFCHNELGLYADTDEDDYCSYGERKDG